MREEPLDCKLLEDVAGIDTPHTVQDRGTAFGEADAHRRDKQRIGYDDRDRRVSSR